MTDTYFDIHKRPVHDVIRGRKIMSFLRVTDLNLRFILGALQSAKVTF